MRDEVFIKETLQKGREAKDKARTAFSNITLEEFNWKSAPGSWSIAQCLDHLIKSDGAYFSELKKITQGNYKMSFWEKYSPFSAKFGQLLKSQLKEQVKKKMKAPKKIQPRSTAADLKLIDDYFINLDIFFEYIANCKTIDIDKTIITSPILKIVTYSLRDAFQFLIQHEHRHINQAIRVKTNENFGV